MKELAFDFDYIIRYHAQRPATNKANLSIIRRSLGFLA